MPRTLILLTALFTSFVIPAQAENAKPTTVRAMTFNIRYANRRDGLNHWAYRADLVASMIRFHRADICGVQEALGAQMHGLHVRLPAFDSVATGRDGRAGGERCAIFYRKDRFERLRWKTFWLSPTPERPSAAWGARLRRIVTWAEFRDTNSEATFFVFNTHFDHASANARRESARLVLDKIDEIAGDAPMLLLGDLNCDPSSTPYRILTTGGIKAKADPARAVRDGYDWTEHTPLGPEGTFSGFGGVDRVGPRIDYVMARGPVRILEHAILTDAANAGRTPSDHRPVLVEARIGESPRRDTIHLEHGWRFRTDPDQTGPRRNLHGEHVEDRDWQVVRAGDAWEQQGAADYDGFAYYRRTMRIPAEWKGRTVHFVAHGIADRFTLFVNGLEVVRPTDATSYWDRMVTIRIPSEMFRPGRANVVTLRVEDTGGYGGLIGRPVHLTTRQVETTHKRK